MKFTITIARIARVPVRLHWTWTLLLLWLLCTWWRYGQAAARIDLFLAAFVCITLHEFGHVFAARYVGIQTKDVTLYFLGGVARLETEPVGSRQEITIALAGPWTNITIIVGLQFGNLVSGAYDYAAGFVTELILINWLIFLFNMIPAFPMDGGRILRGVLGFWLNWKRATKIAAHCGQGFGAVFCVAGYFWQHSLIMIGLLIFTAATGQIMNKEKLEKDRGE